MRPTRWLLAALALASLHCGGSSQGGGGTPDAGGQPDAGGSGQECTGIRMTAYVDADGDHFGSGAPVSVCVPSGPQLYPPAGYAWSAGDCDDHDPSKWREDQLYVDADGDGFRTGELVTVCAGSTVPAGYVRARSIDEDCAPDDPNRRQLLFYSYRDADGDGRFAPSSGMVCSGREPPAGYANMVSGLDCDDADPLAWSEVTGYADADGDGRGSGPLLTLCGTDLPPAGYSTSGDDCAPEDPTRWQYLYFSYRDADGDGFTVYGGYVCAGSLAPPGYTDSSRGSDCDDGNPAVWASRTAYLDADSDGVGAGSPVQLCTNGTLPPSYATTTTDCAPEDPNTWRSYSYTYRDADGDGHTVYQSGTVCYGQQLPPGYGTVRNGDDCDDSNPSLHARVFAYRDADGDGVGAGQAETFCTSEGATPAGYSLQGTDCADDDPDRWRVLAYKAVDRDGDGYTAPETGSVCTGATLPDPYRAATNGNDCDDANTGLWRWVVLYRDLDGDGIGAGPRSVFCLGTALPEGWSIFGYDEDDGDPGTQTAEDGGLLTQL